MPQPIEHLPRLLVVFDFFGRGEMHDVIPKGAKISGDGQAEQHLITSLPHQDIHIHEAFGRFAFR